MLKRSLLSVFWRSSWRALGRMSVYPSLAWLKIFCCWLGIIWFSGLLLDPPVLYQNEKPFWNPFYICYNGHRSKWDFRPFGLNWLSVKDTHLWCVWMGTRIGEMAWHLFSPYMPAVLWSSSSASGSVLRNVVYTQHSLKCWIPWPTLSLSGGGASILKYRRRDKGQAS